MSLDQVKELFMNSNVNINGSDNKDKSKEFFENLKETETFKVIENYLGVAFSGEQTYNLAQFLGLAKKNPDTNYIVTSMQ
jgi:hypothetical protein